jgi:hypothetical protein
MVLWHMEYFFKRTYVDKERFTTRGRQKVSTARVHVCIRKLLIAKARVALRAVHVEFVVDKVTVGKVVFPF